MKPKIEAINNGRNVYFVHVNGVQIGSEIQHPMEAIQIEFWLRESWPDLVVAVLASSNVEQPKKKRKVRK